MYSAKEVREVLDGYLLSSADRLRARLKNAWRKQASIKQSPYHAETKV